MTTLINNTDYGYVFGLSVNGDKEGTQKGQMIYNGGINFTARSPKGEVTLDSQGTYDKVFAYINLPVRN